MKKKTIFYIIIHLLFLYQYANFFKRQSTLLIFFKKRFEGHF